MKKLIAAIVIGAALVFAAPPTNDASVNYSLTTEFLIAKDTVASTDSSTIAYRLGALEAKQFLLAYAPFTEDSAKIQVVVDALDANGTFLFRTVVDSIQTTGDIVDLSVLPAPAYTVKLKGYTGNGGQVIMNNISILSRKAVQKQQ
jgi:hypothetical protein